MRPNLYTKILIKNSLYAIIYHYNQSHLIQESVFIYSMSEQN